ncbi:MAG: HAD family hydrolase [Oscillospiraceae bacterium]|nr:HAD family hydrolase [Oscillospiraceae bacterium]
MNVAFIPVRGGSKSIPFKNIRCFCGKPLVYWTTLAAQNSQSVDVIYIATDSGIISEVVNSFGFTKVKVIGRSDENSSDNASTESVMLEFAEKYDFDNIVLIQATSPFLTSDDIDGGFELFYSGNADSVLSAVKQKRFNWNIGDDGSFYPLNYDFMCRPRRQDFDGYYTENGAFYITSRQKLIETKCRISGRIKIYPMCNDSFFEIDEPSDWIIMEHLMRNRQNKVSINKIKLFVTDCDGVLTDGGMYYTDQGDVMKKFNTRDGMGISLLKTHGIITALITGENSQIAKKRAEKLGFDRIFIGVDDKAELLKKICAEYRIFLSETAYIGDDINDIECIRICGSSACPADADEKIMNCVDYVCRRNGGCGAVREFAELILDNRKIL